MCKIPWYHLTIETPGSLIKDVIVRRKKLKLEIRKNAFHFTSKRFSFLKYSNLRILKP